MNYKSKLMGLSLILLAAISACTDEVENGGSVPGMDDHRISFAVSTQNQTNGTRSAVSPETHELGSVEMEGTLDGKPLFLTAEVSDGFPCDHQPSTRGTQVTAAGDIEAFGVSAYTDKDAAPDVMYSVKATRNTASSSTVWTTAEPYYWPTGKTLSFYAWYPYASSNLTVSDKQQAGPPIFTYEVPTGVNEQEDLMGASSSGSYATGNPAVSIQLRHLLTAVKFKASADMPACSIKTITLKNVKYKGSRTFQTLQGSNDVDGFNETTDTKDFILDVNQELNGYGEATLTDEGKTFFMMPQELGDDACLEVLVIMNSMEQTLTAKLKDITADAAGSSSWKAGKTVTYKLSHSWAWEEPSRNLPAGKQLLNNGEHTLTYDFAVTTGKAPIHDGRGKFVITPIYADGRVCDDVKPTEVEFTVTEGQTQVKLNLEANPHYNLLRMIQIKVTTANGTEKTLKTVDFQEAKTDNSGIVVWPDMLTLDLTTYGNSGSVVAGKTVGKNGFIQREKTFNLGYSEMTWKDNAQNKGNMTTNGSTLQNGIEECQTAMLNWDGIWNTETDKISYLQGSNIRLPSEHSHKSCYGTVKVNLSNWMLGFWTYSKQGNYIGYWDYRTTTSRLNDNDKFEDGKICQNKITNKSKQFIVDLLDKQQAGLENQKPWYDQYNTSRWNLEKDDVILRKAAATNFWGYVTARCIRETNSYNLQVMGDYRMRVEIVPHNAAKMDTNTAFFDCGTHVHRANQPNSGNVTDHPNINFGHVCVAYKEKPRDKSLQNQGGFFYWDDTYQIENVSWSLSRAAAGIDANSDIDLNKQ